MIIILILSIVIIGIYVFLILIFNVSFIPFKTFQYNQKPVTTFSIIIPFRNEEKQLPVILSSLTKLSYPKKLFEILFVDDDSTDHSVSIINNFKIQNPKLRANILKSDRQTNSPKKDAINTAIKVSNHNWVVTTDADCNLNSNWLKSLDVIICKRKPNMIVAPVHISTDISFISQFQSIDFLSLQGATIGCFGCKMPLLCNGANLAYQTSVFRELSGFKGNEQIASGDDVFLLEKFITHNKTKVTYANNYDTLVHTKPVKKWNALIEQRKRWAGKSRYYTNTNTKLIGVLVLLSNCIIIFSLLLFIEYPIICLSIILLKWSVDSLLIYKTAKAFKHSFSVRSYLKTIFIYPFFTVYIALSSLYTSFKWKGRVFKA